MTGISSSFMESTLINDVQLDKLTAKLEQRLRNNGSAKELGKGRERKGKELRNDGDHKPRPQPEKARSEKTTSKKRDIRGKTKATTESPSKPLGAAKSKGQEKAAQPAPEAKLRQEVLELGGTEEDFALVADVTSDSEVEGPTASEFKGTKASKGLEKDVASFMQKLGIHEASQDSVSAEDEAPKEASVATGKLKAESANVVESRPPPAAKAGQMLFSPRPDWHASELRALPTPRPDPSIPPPEIINKLQTYALQLLKAENDRYSSDHRSASSSHRFLSTIMSSGTLSDKISALTLLVQESPLHNMKALESLIALAKKKNRDQAVNVLAALKDLLGQGELLPSQRRLKAFSAQPPLLEALQHKTASAWRPGQTLPGQLEDAHLVFWAYEDWLKAKYFEIIRILEAWCNDEVSFARARCLGYVYDLLTHKPEQEANLLRLLVNKLGDVDKKIASKASLLLLQLQSAHPLMKPIVISTIESDVIFRPRQNPHAKYYAIITLNQTVLSGNDEHVATKLLEIYFALFTALLGAHSEKHDPESGKNLKTEKPQKAGGKGRGKGTTTRTKPDKIQASTSAEEETREKMISAILTGVNRAFPYAGKDDSIVRKHLDTLFRITHSSNFNSSVQALMLLEQLSSSRRQESDRFYRTLYESLLDPRLLTSSKQAMYLNLLFKSLKSDLNIKRVKAFVKRLLQITTLHQPGFACGVFYLIKELEETFSGLHDLITQPESVYEDEEEHFQDVPDETDDKAVAQLPPDSKKPQLGQKYDGRKRDPEYSNADRTCLWEIVPFLAHFHPSVRHFAVGVLENGPKPPKPDLSLHTLIHFLDRFVYRNPKITPTARGVSIMQPTPGGSIPGLLLQNRDTGKAQAPLNSAQFASKPVEEVPVDQVFFHKYFSQVGGRSKISARKPTREAHASDDEDDGDEDEVWKAIIGSKPELDPNDEGDDDLELEDDDWSDEEEEEDVESMEAGPQLDAELDDFPADGHLDLDAGSLIDSEDDLPSETAGQVPDQPAGGQKANRTKRRKLKHLPTFAPADQYESMLAGEEDG